MILSFCFVHMTKIILYDIPDRIGNPCATLFLVVMQTTLMSHKDPVG